jgi:capsule polysaccharide modification protein KpsS
MHVSEDTNLVLRSKLDNFDALREVIDFAKKKKLPLVFKMHPSETNEKFLMSLYEFLRKNENKNIIITDINAFLLAKNSKYCFTINSTLGLEAMIYGIDVEILGDALYKGWTEEHIKHYITGFLIDMPYFDIDGEIPANSVKQLLERLTK